MDLITYGILKKKMEGVTEEVTEAKEAAQQAQAKAEQAQAKAKTSETNAKTSETNAAHSATEAAETVENLNTQFQNAMSALTVDSEVQNIRVGEDGTTYPSAGEAVRGQIAELKSQLGEYNEWCPDGYKVYDKNSEVTRGYYINNQYAYGGKISDPATTTADSQMGYVVVDVSYGDKILLTTGSKAGGGRRAFVIATSQRTVMQVAATATPYTDSILDIIYDGFVQINVLLSSDFKILHLSNVNKKIKQQSARAEDYLNQKWFHYNGAMVQGEYGGFSQVEYAIKTPYFKLPYPAIARVPDGYKMAKSVNGTKVTYDNFAYIAADIDTSLAVISKHGTQTLDPNNEEHQKLISISAFETFDDLYPTFSTPAIFPEIGIIGDSYSLGSMHWENNGYKGYPELSWGKLMCKRNGNSCTLYSHGGYGISRWIDEIYPTLSADTPKQLYWWGLGINDAETAHTSPSTLGSLDDLSGGDYTQYPNTLYGMYAKAYEMVKAFAPLAKHVFVTCIGATRQHRYDYYKEINQLFADLSSYYGVPLIDLVDDPFYISMFYENEISTNHPTLIGYGGMSYANERLLNRCIVNNWSYFKDYGRTNNPDDTDSTGSL